MGHLLDLRWMLPPLAMCLVLTGIHGYLGIHVLSRKVIFVDLALAQIAALGSTCAFLLGYDPRVPGDGLVVYLFSLGFAFAGAAVFSLTRMRHERVPQEAFIGITYATSSALALLVLSKAAGEGEHIKEMLVGNVLLVTWPTVLKTALIYAVVGAFHYVFRRPFLEISADPDAAQAAGRRVRLWDFLFYASFGLVITSSVAVAGVLLVFSFLVVPAVIAFMFAERIGARIGTAWVMGSACSAAGMLLSYYGDLPTGPSVVACFAGTLLVAAAVYYMRAAADRGRASARLAVGAAAVAALFALTLTARKEKAEHEHGSQFAVLSKALESPDENTQIEAVHHLAELKDPHAVAPLVRALQRPPSDRVAEHIVQVLPDLGDPATAAVPALQDLAARSDDPFLRLEVAAALLHLKSRDGFVVLLALLDNEPPLLLEQKVAELLKATTGQDFGIGRSEEDDARERARERFKEWLAAKGSRLRWRSDLRRFE